MQAFQPEAIKKMGLGGSSGPATSHMVASSRSKHPWGPYEDSPYNPIVRTQSRSERWLSKGHGSIVDTPDDEWWIIYHAFEKGYYTLGRQTLLEPLEWTEDGWFRIPEGVSAHLPIRKPSGCGQALIHNGHEQAFQSESGELGYAWSWYKPTGPIEYAVEGRAVTVSTVSSSPPLVFMPEDHEYEAQVEIDISEGTSGRFVLFYNDKTYSGIELSGEGLHGVIRGWRTPAKAWPSRHLVVRL